MKKSYHSIVVPIVEAMTALRRCALCSDADSVPYVAAMAMGLLLLVSLRPTVQAFCGPVSTRIGGAASVLFHHDGVTTVLAVNQCIPRGVTETGNAAGACNDQRGPISHGTTAAFGRSPRGRVVGIHCVPGDHGRGRADCCAGAGQCSLQYEPRPPPYPSRSPDSCRHYLADWLWLSPSLHRSLMFDGTRCGNVFACGPLISRVATLFLFEDHGDENTHDICG